MRIIGYSDISTLVRSNVKVFGIIALLLLVNLRRVDTASAAALQAQPGTVTWTGAGDGVRWTTKANWDTGHVPASNDIVRFGPAPAGTTIEGAFIGTIAGLKLDAGFRGTLRFMQPVHITGDLDVLDGVLNGGPTSLSVDGAVRVKGGMLITPHGVMRVNSLDIQAPGIVQMGIHGKLNLAGDGTPLSGNGLLDVTTNRPNSVEYTGHATGSLDLAGPAGALQSIKVSTSAMQRLAAGRSISAPLAPHASPLAPLFAEYDNGLTLNSGENGLTTAVIDTANGFAYFGTITTPGIIIKVNLATFQREGALILTANESGFTSAAIDEVNGFAYFGTFTNPGVVVKINLSTFTSVGDLTLDANAGEGYLASAVMDSDNGFVYFGTSQSSPGNVIRVNLNGADVPVLDGVLPLNAGEDNLLSAVIGTVAGQRQIYFGTQDVNAVDPGKIVNVDPANFSRTGALVLNASEPNPTSAVIDADNNAAYFATSTNPINIVKVQLSPLSRVGSLQPFGSTYDAAYAGAIDTNKGYAYFAAYGQPGLIAQVAISPTFTTVQTITLQSGEDNPVSAVIDPANRFAYFGTSTDPGIVVRVALFNARTTVTSSDNPSVFGEPVTFTATVSPLGTPGTPTGVVTFTLDNGPIVIQTLSGGLTTYTPVSLTVGTHYITATYGGNGTYDSVTGTLTQVVNMASTTTAVSSSANPASYGQVLTFTSTVSAVAPGGGTPTGPLTFVIDGTPLSAQTLNGSGIATYVTSTLAPGIHTVAAQYGGSTNYITSTGTLSPSQIVNKAGTLATVSSSSNPSVFGQAVTFTTIVSVVAPGGGTPTGVVTFTIDGVVAATPALSVNRVASFTTSSLIVGTHTVSVTFSSSTNYTGTTAAVANGQVVSKANTTTSVASSANPSAFGQSIILTATVAPVSPGAGTPTGTVSFSVDGVVAGSGALGGGVATFSTSSIPAGTHAITATYGGNASFNGSTGALASGQQVNKAAISSSIVSSLNPSVYGQTVTFTVLITPVAPGAGTPTGVISFSIDGAFAGTRTVIGGGATYVTQTLAVGTHTVVGVYMGDASFNTSTATLSPIQTVNKANTSTSVNTSANPIVYGQVVTFTSTVAPISPGGGIPDGVVHIFIDGSTAGASSLSNGSAVFTATSLAVGTHTITMTYDGSANFNGSTGSLAPVQQVTRAGSTTGLVSSSNPSVFGQPVTFTATVTALSPSIATPTGPITFTIDGTPYSSQSLVGGIAAYTTSTLTVGIHTVSATYGGSVSFTTSTGNLAGNQTVNIVSTTTTIASSANASVFGDPVTFTVIVSAVAPSVAIPSGVVTITLDNGIVGTPTLVNGQASYTAPSLSMGTHTITASFRDAASFSPSSSVLVQTVRAAGSTTTVTSSLNPSIYGQVVTFTAKVTTPSGTPTGVVTISVDGIPVSGQPLGPSGIVTFATGSLAAGSRSITAQYSGDTNIAGSTGILSPTQVVNKAGSTTVVTSSPNPSVFSQQVTITATVSAVAPGIGTPTGTVTFTVDNVLFGTRPLTGGRAILTTTLIGVGAHSVNATYGGETNFTGSTASLPISQTVTRAGTTTGISVSANPVTVTNAVTFTATVGPVAPATGTPTGVVTFTINGSTAGTAPLVGGVASFTTSTLMFGTYTVTASYGGDAGFSPSNATLVPVLVVKPAQRVFLPMTLR